MASLGQKLADARKRKGISIPDAHESTKIRGDYLEKFENDDFNIKLPRVYLRGFLKNYASYLGLDPEGIATDFDAIHEDPKVSGNKTFGTIIVDSTREEAPSQDHPPAGQGPSFPWLKVGLILGGLLASTIILVLLVKSLSGGGEASPVEDKNETVVEPIDKDYELKLIATGPIKLLFIKTNSKDQISKTFRNMKNGDEEEITLTGKPSFSGGASSIENLTIEVDGRPFHVSGTGAVTFSWPPKPSPKE